MTEGPHPALAVMQALQVPMSNFRALWEQYRTSSFRRDWLETWAGDDADKQRIVREWMGDPPPDVHDAKLT